MRLYFRGRKIRLSRKQEIVLARRVIAAVILLAFAILTTAAIYNKAAPIAIENAAALTRTKWESRVTQTVESVMQEGDYSYQSFAANSFDQSGKLTAISVNSRNISAARSALAQKLNRYFSENNKTEISVPIGSIIAPRFFQGVGFGVDINTMTYTAVSVTIVSDVKAVGINQTMHRISAKITTDTTLYCTNEKAQFSHQYDVILAESLTFGSIPDSYFEYGN